MKNTMVSIKYKLSFLMLALLTTIYTFAQDQGTEGGATTVSKTTTHTATTNGTDWYAAPWVWVVGIAVFILLLFAIIRGGSSRTTDVHRTTTVRKDVTAD